VVVGHGDDDVELARVAGRVACAHEHRVGRERPARIDPFGARRLHRRRDDEQLLVAEQAALAGVRIEPGDGDARLARREPARCGGGDPDRLEDRVEGDRLDRLAQRGVDRDQHGAQLVVGQHHAHRRRRRAGAGRERLQHLGVAGVADAGGSERFLVDRRRDQRRGRAGSDDGDRLLDAARRGRAGARVDAAERRLDQVGREAVGLQHRNASGRQRRRVVGRVDPCHRKQAAGEGGGAAHHRDVADDEGAARVGRAEPGGDDLRTDAAGVAHRQRERPAQG
jgi:hypothetical protein